MSHALLLWCMAASLLACEARETALSFRSDPRGNILRFDVYGPLGSLDPIGSDGGGSHMIFPFLYSYLFVENESRQLDPDLAVAWDYDVTTLTWTIHLRQDALFHTGRPVTASDVEYSLRRGFAHGALSSFELIERIDPVGDSTVRITLNHDAPDLLWKIWSTPIVLRPESGGVDYTNQPVGSGPFRFESREEDKEVHLVANRDYYRGRPALDGVIFTFEPDRERSWARLLSEKTDLALGLHPTDYEMIKRYEDRFHFNTIVEPYRTVLLYNTSDPLFADSRVRLALAHAVDKDYIINRILKGMGVVCSGTMGHYSPFRNPKIDPIPFDPQKSLELLREAGWSTDRSGRTLQKEGKDFEFTILCFQEIKLHERIGQYIRLCLNDLGIKVHLQVIPFDELTQRYREEQGFQAALTEFVDVRDNLKALQVIREAMAGGRAPEGVFSDPLVGGLWNDAFQEQNPVRRQELLHQLDSLLTSLQPAMFLYQRASLNVLSSRFQSPHSFASLFATYHLWTLSRGAD